MFRATVGCLKAALSRPRVGSTEVLTRPWVGCSHWTTPYRPLQSFSTRIRIGGDGLFDPAEPARDADEDQSVASELEDEGWMDPDTSQEGIVIDQIKSQASTSIKTTSTPPEQPTRPTLPTSIKKLNRLLSHSRDTTIPESDLIEKFVKGRGPGGQAINKTNSSVSLIHIPTGIRIQSQPTRSREENRKIARKILGERLDLIRARAGQESVGGGGGGTVESVQKVEAAMTVGGSRKDKERVLAKQFSRDEIRWEKERRRKSNKAKKAKKKHGSGLGVASNAEDGGNQP